MRKMAIALTTAALLGSLSVMPASARPAGPAGVQSNVPTSYVAMSKKKMMMMKKKKMMMKKNRSM